MIRERPYDIVMDDRFRAQVRARRVDPDGEPRKVGTMRRGGQTVLKYPWDKLLLGDFFIAPLNGCRYEIAANKMYQMARVRDIEIALRRWDDNGTPSIRVTLVLKGIRELKHKARLHHKRDIPVHDREAYLKRRAAEQRAAYRRRRAASATPTLVEVPPVTEEAPAPPTPASAPILDPEAAVPMGDAETLDARARLMRLRSKAQNEDG